MDTNEVDAPPKALDLIQNAIHSGTPIQPLLDELAVANGVSSLDPLEVVPVVIPSKDEAARKILSLIAKECRPREVIMAIQEAMERLEMLFDDYDSEEEEASGGRNAPLPLQLQILVEMFATSIPRLDKRKRTASETIKPLFSDIQSIVRKTGQSHTVEQGKILLRAITPLVKNVQEWCRENSDGDDFLACSVILRAALETMVEALHHCLNTSIAQRSFEHFFPRLTIRSSVPSGWESDEEIAKSIVESHNGLPTGSKNSASLFFVAYSTSTLTSLSPTSLSDSTLSFVPSIVAAFQTNVFLGEALAILLHTLSPKSDPPSSATLRAQATTSGPAETLPSSTTHPLLALLPSVASSHPNPSIRHISYRVLSLLLFTVPPADRLHVLYDLAQGDESSGGAGPAMKVGAIGLIKESVFDAIGRVDSKGNPFGTEKGLDVLGGVLLKPHNPELFGDEKMGLVGKRYEEVGKDEMEITEIKRVSECLGLYYAWLLRDVMNVTHVRDQKRVDEVDAAFLQPVKITIERWQKEIDDEAGELKDVDMMPLISLQMNLERVLEVRDRVVARPRKNEKWR